MKNFVQPGNVIEVAAPTALSSGDGFIVGSLFLVAQGDALIGTQLNGGVEGVYDVAKLSTDAMSVGDKVNWDDTAKELKLAAGDLDGVATVVEAAIASTTSVKVKLTQI